jgi:hypothetical protein
MLVMLHYECSHGGKPFHNMSKKEKTEKGSTTPEVVHEHMKQESEEAASALTIYGGNPYALTMPDNLPEADYLAFGTRIGKAMQFVGWKIGDFVNYGVTTYGYKDYEKLASVTGLDETYLRTCSSVANRIPLQHRGDASMEKFRLMLGRMNEKETVPHLVKRLGKKTVSQLRDMAKSGEGSRTGGATPTMGGEELHTMLDDAVEGMSALHPDKYAAFRTIEKENPVLPRLRKMLDMFERELRDSAVSAEKKA